MRYLIIICLLLFSCAGTKEILDEQPLKYSYLPQKVMIDSIMPEFKNVVDTSLPDFESISIDSGRLITVYKETSWVHPGILLSEKKAAQFIFYKSNYEYMLGKAKVLNYLYVNYYDQSFVAEKKYQQVIKQLQKDVQRSWLEKNVIYVGFVAGVATAILTEYAVIKSSK